jgi:hypothetical protein
MEPKPIRFNLKGEIIMKNIMKFMDEHTGVAVCGILVAASTATVVMYKRFLDKLYGNEFQEDEV